MKLEREKDSVEGFLCVASQRWGVEEAGILRSTLERTTEAIRDVECFELDPDDEPWRPPRKE